MATDPRLARSNPPTTIATPPPPPPPPTEAVPAQNLMVGLDGAQDENGREGEMRKEDGGFKLKFCTVCASNNNRSMEAHLRLSLSTYPVLSFGTGSLVRLPGPTITQPNVYAFNTTSYSTIISSLLSKDPRLYRANGVLNMLERNRAVKYGPERWQDWPVGHPRTDALRQGDKGARGVEAGVVDVVVTCEERCWDAVVDNLLERGSPLNRPVHVINVDIKDNHEEALVGGRAILDLADCLNRVAREERERGGVGEGEGWSGTGFDERVPEVLAEWQVRWPHLPALWTLGWF